MKIEMRFNWKRALSLVMALALIISFVPHNALHSHAEETEEPEVEAQASNTLPKGQSPEQVAGDGLTWVKDGDEDRDCGVLVEHTHGDGICVYICSHSLGHTESVCYNGEWGVCSHGEHADDDLVYDFTNVKVGQIVSMLTNAGEFLEWLKNEYDLGDLGFLTATSYYKAVKGKVFCYAPDLAAGLICDHKDGHSIDCCELSEHTHTDACYVANWKEVADINNNEVDDTLDPSYTVKYMDGETELASHTVLVGLATPAYEGEIPVREYYTFAGWGNVADTVTADVVYTAQWTINNDKNSNEIPDETEAHYTVTFVVDGAVYHLEENVLVNLAINAPANPVLEGYGFDAWLDANGAAVSFPYTVTGDITLTAKFSNRAARIGDVYYESLLEAIAAAQPGETVVMLKDATLGKYVQNATDAAITISKAITLDGNGYTLTSKAGRAINVDVAGQVEIKNLTIKQYAGRNGNDQKRCINVIGQPAELKVTNCTLELVEHTVNSRKLTSYTAGVNLANSATGANVTVDGCKINVIYGVQAHAVATVTIKNTTIDKALYGVNVTAAATVKLENSVLNGNPAFGANNRNISILVQSAGAYITADANTVINAVSPSGGPASIVFSTVENVVLNIDLSAATLNKVNASDPLVYLKNAEAQIFDPNGTVMYDTLADAIATGAAKIEILADALKSAEGVASVNDDFSYFYDEEEGKHYAVVKDFVASINGKGYTSLPKAIEAAQNGDTIVVLADITGGSGTLAYVSGKTVTIDLGGHTIDHNGSAFVVQNEGNLTLRNGVLNGLNRSSGTILNAGGTLVLDDGLIVSSKHATDDISIQNRDGKLTINGGACIDRLQIDKGEVVINAGSIVGAIEKNGTGTLTIYGGYFSQDVTEWVAPGYACVADTNNGDGYEATIYKVENHDGNNNGVKDEDETFTVTVEGEGTYELTGAVSVGNGKYVFDSTKAAEVTITAAPVVKDNVSKTYVASVAGAELTYGEGFVATAIVSVKNGDEIVVTFAEAKFVLDEDGKMRFYVGMEDPDYETLYNAIIASPEYTAEFVGQNVKYLARTEGEYDIDLSAIRDLLGEIKYVGSLAVKAFDAAYPEAKTSITLEEKWLNVGDPFEEGNVEEAVEEAINAGIEEIKALIDAGEWTKVVSTITELGTEVAEKVGTIGCHAFGKNTLTDTEGNVQEIISVVYDNGAMRLADDTLVVTLVDDRIETVINAEDITVVYRDYTAEELAAAIAPVLVDVNGNSVDGNVVLSSKVKGTEIVGTFEVTFEYKGSYDYKPATKTVVVTVEKAPASIDIPNVQVTYGEAYNVDPTVTLGNQYGDPAELTDSLIQFVVGLDISEFDYNNDGVKGLNTKVQLMLPAEIQELLDTVLGLTGNDTSNGMEMSLSELMNYLDLIPDTSLDSLNQALEAITSVVEAGDLTIVIGGELPTNVGAYLYGAVSTSGNYETAFDVAYIVIAPALKEVYLDWNYTDTNGIFTWELLKHVDLGATAFDDAAFTTVNETATAAMQNLFFGVDENGELVIVLHGKNTELEALEASLGNGAYAQLAFTLDLGNELVYAVPIARAVVIVPGVAKVEIVDAEGNALDTFTYTFDKTAKQLYVMVDGELVECEIIYTGVQTNVTVVEPTTNAPVHAGAYAAVATYIGRDANGEIVAVGIDAAALVIEPAQSTIEVTGGSFEHDGEAHGVTVVAPADVTLISGTVTFDAAGDGLGIEDVQGVLNVDFPKWLDKILSEKFADAYANGVSTASFLFKLQQHEAAMLEMGITEEIINSLTNLMKNLPDNVVVYFNDNVAYTEPGAYAYVGIVTDSDYLPSYDTGLVVIGKEGMVVDMLDTTVTYNGKGQFVNIYNPNNSDYVAIIIDRENNIGNIILEDDLSHLVTLLEKGLGRELPKTINVAELMAAIDKALTELEGAELPADAAAILTQVREALSKLPQSGVVYINGEWLPTDVGEYEFYGAAYALYYTTNLTEAVLTIVPAQVTVTLEDKNVHVGDDMPELTYTVSGLIEGETLVVTPSCKAENTETAGTFDITATYVENKNYAVTVVDATLTVEPHVEGKVVVENNDDPTCTEPGKYDNVVYCTVCGDELSRETVTVDALGHKYEATVTAPTCTEKGYTTYTCSVCGDNYVADEVAALGHTKETIPAVEATFDNVGWTEGVKCSVCGEILVAPQEIAKLIAVAQNVETGAKYEKLSEAIAEVKNGETIVFLADIDEDVTIKQVKNVAFTIDGDNFKYTGTMTVTNGSANQKSGLTVTNVEFVVDVYGIYSYEKKVAYNITVDGCSFVGEGYNDYGMYLRYVNNVVVKNTTGTGLFDLVYGNSSFTGFTAENVTVTDSQNGIVLSYVNSTATFKDVTTDVIADGVIIRDNAGGTVTFEDCNIDNVQYWDVETVTNAVKMIFNDAENNLNISGASDKLTIVLNKVDTTVTCATEGLNAVSGVDGYLVVYENGIYRLAKPVAQIGEVKYAKLSAALAEVQNGETIVFLADIDEDVTIKQVKNVAFTIDGDNFKYTGTMTVTNGSANQKSGLTVTNVEFVVDVYGIYSYEKKVAYNITVDGCSFVGEGYNDYGMYLRYVNNVVVKNTTGTGLFDLVYGNSSFTGFTAENVTVTDSQNGIVLSYVNSTATFKDVTTDVIADGVIIRDNAGGTVTFEDCNIDNVQYWDVETVTNAVKMIFNDAENNLNISGASDKLTIVLNKVDTTVTCATEGLNAITTEELAKTHKVAYENGVYFLKEIVYVAQVGETKYETIQDAVNAAQDGETVVVIADHEVDCNVNPLVKVAGKDITIDLNGKVVTANVTEATTRVVFETASDAKLTVKDSVGTGKVVANGDGILHYMFKNAGEMVIESGNFELAALNGGAMFFSVNSNMTVNGGNFTQTTNGWMFNADGNGDYVITVYGGTYNRYFIGGNTVEPQENLWGEVVLAEGKCLVNNNDGTWTVGAHTPGEAVEEMRDTNGDGIKDAKFEVVYCSVCGEELSADLIEAYVCWNPATGVYYADLSDALTLVSDSAAEEIEMLADVTEAVTIVYPGTTLDLNGKTVESTFVVGLNGSHVVDNTRKGLLKVASENITLATNNTETPVRDNTLGGYRFGAFYVVDQGLTENADGSLTYRFVHKQSGALAHYFTDNGASDNEIMIVVSVSWVDENGHYDERYYTYSDAMIQDVADGGQRYTCVITGVENITNLKICAKVITTNARVENSTVGYTYN